MIDDIDSALKGLFSREFERSGTEVDLSFAWPGTLVTAAQRRPTVNLFLWNVDVRQTTFDGARPKSYKPVLVDSATAQNPWVEAHYLMSIWCEREQDQHRLLGQALGFVWAARAFGIESSGVTHDATLRLESAQDRRLDAVWSSMERRLRPASDLVVTTQLPVYG